MRLKISEFKNASSLYVIKDVYVKYIQEQSKDF
jgi:hypothetical protein